MKAIVSLLSFVLVCSGCRISEFFCDNGECVGLDKFCDGKQDCSDSSDETKFCTRCNRTYYGDRYKTYTLDLSNALLEKVPLVCLLTFMAGGGELGDIVELTFSRFSLGAIQDDEGSVGCKQGYLQILERGATPDTAGKFCGSSDSLPVYYSETNNVSLMLALLNVPGTSTNMLAETADAPRDADAGSDLNMGYLLPRDNLSRARVSSPVLGGSLSAASSMTVSPLPIPNLGRGTPWVNSATSTGSHSELEFAVKFRFVSKSEAVTRYGPPNSPFHRGEWIPGTACDRSFQDCDSQPCKMQSPNFPGLYPRNVTCLFHITQRTIPRRMHALVSLHQAQEDKVSIKDKDVHSGSHDSQLSSFARFAVPHEKHLLFGEACLSHDFVRVYDGSDTSAPVLATFCRQGALPALVASGPEMVIEFQTASLDVLELHSFEFNVDVDFVGENDIGVRMVPQTPQQTPQRCEWIVDGTDKRSGIVHSLRHLAPANTSCTILFRGRRHDVVWLYFVKYSIDRSAHDTIDVEYEKKGDISRPVILGELYDGIPNGEGQFPIDTPVNATLMDTFSAEKSVRLCVHARNFPGFVPLRPCRYPDESYLSTGRTMFLRYNFTGDVNLQYLRFDARYEFVNTYVEGDPAPQIAQSSSVFSVPCSRILRSSQRQKGDFTSPKNVFLFGRGGLSSLICTYQFVGKEGETIRLVFRKLRLGNRKCDSPYDPYSNRYTCRNEGSSSIHPSASTATAQIIVSQTLWGRYEIPLACLCKLEREITLEIMSNMATVNFTIDGMTTLDDFIVYYFEASYEFSSTVQCSRDKFLLDRPNGEIAFQVTDSDLRMSTGLPIAVRCPWLLAASLEKTSFLKISGTTSVELCDTRNRVLVFAPDDLEPLASVCPNPSGNVVSSSSSHSTSRSFPGMSQPGVTSTTHGHREVEVYPKSWNRTYIRGRQFGRMRNSPNLLMEFIVLEAGKFSFKWVRADRPNSANRLLGRRLRSDGQCLTGCSGSGGGCKGSGGSEGSDVGAESSSSDCDLDEQHNSPCPPGGGGGAACFVAHFPWLYVGIGIGCGVLVTTVLVVSLVHRRRETKAKKGKPVPTDEFPMDVKELDC